MVRYDKKPRGASAGLAAAAVAAARGEDVLERKNEAVLLAIVEKVDSAMMLLALTDWDCDWTVSGSMAAAMEATLRARRGTANSRSDDEGTTEPLTAILV